jgi:hypothetical protein
MSNQEPGDDGWVRWHWPSRRGRRDGVLGRLWRELDGHGRLLIFGGAAVLIGCDSLTWPRVDGLKWLHLCGRGCAVVTV